MKEPNKLDQVRGPDRKEWVLGELLTDPERLFVLWAIKARFCTSLDDFRNRYGPNFPIGRLVDALSEDGFVRQGTDELVLTETGEQAVTCLGDDDVSAHKVSQYGKELSLGHERGGGAVSTLFKRLGKYEIISRLGRGGMADVYLAYDTGETRQVALKLIEIGPSRDAQDALAAERRGVVLQARLCDADSRVAAVHTWGEMDGHFYIDMEYVEGQDLSEMLLKGLLNHENAVEIAIEICEMLETSHALRVTIDNTEFEGIIHGDIKPSNVRIDRNGEVKVLDFGIAKALSLTRKLTRNEFGSAAYSSPERLDTGDVDTHSDLWSIGVLLYEMITGEQPFQADTTRKLERLILSRKQPRPLPDACPQSLKSVISKALAPDLDQRYPSATDFKADLQAVRDGRPTLAEREVDREPTKRTRTLAAAASGISPQPDNQSARKPDDETKRTRVPDRSAGPKSKSWPLRASRRSIRNILAAVLALVVIGLFANELLVWNDTSQLKDDLSGAKESELNMLWDRYQQLSRRSFLFGLGLQRVRGPLKDKFLSYANDVMADYSSNDFPSKGMEAWQLAQNALLWANQLDPKDATLSASMQYCEGQVLRFKGESRRLNKDSQGADNLFRSAVNKFKAAANSRPKWPDPYLGLARVYIYGLNEIDNGVSALRQAEQLGYSFQKREKAQIADGYHKRGIQIWQESKNLRGTPQEKELLIKAKNDYEEASKLYQEIIPFARATRNLADTQANLRLVDQRRKELQEASKE